MTDTRAASAPQGELASADRLDWRVIAPLALSNFVVLAHAAALAPLATEISRDLNTTVSLVAQVSAVALLAMALFGLVSGPLADHYGQRRFILSGLSVLLTSAVVMGVAPAFPVLIGGGLLAGLGASMSVGTAVGLVAIRYRGEAQRRAMSRLQAAMTTGSVMGAPILTAIAAVAQWRGAYLSITLVYALAIVSIARAVPATHQPPANRVSLETILSAYRPLLRHRDMLGLFASSLLRSIGWFGPLFFVGAFLEARYDLSLRQVGLVYMGASGGIFFGNIAAGGHLGRYDLRLAYTVVTAWTGLCSFVIFALPIGAIPTAITIALGGFGVGSGWILLQTMLARETPVGMGTTMTMNLSLFALGSALGAALGGVFVSVGDYRLLGYAAPIFAIAACLPTAHALLRPAAVTAEDAVS